MVQPFLEHPTGEHETELEAMEDAIRRLAHCLNGSDGLRSVPRGRRRL